MESDGGELKPNAAPSMTRFRIALQDIPLFRGVDAALVGQLTPEMRRVYNPHEVLCREGGPADHLFVLLRGDVRVERDEIPLVTRRRGEVMGELAFIEQTVRGATAVAITQVEALRIPHRLLEEFLEDRVFVRNLLRAVSAKLSEATEERAIRYRQEMLLMAEFSAHLSTELRDRLLATGENYGRPRRATAVVLFSDIRNFTARSSRLSALDVAEQLTPYFDRVVEVIHGHGGVVDKFIGDAVMAFWGLEETAPGEMVASAFACAKGMVATARSLTFGGDPIEIGVGLNLGDVFMGNVGSERKRQFTVLGTAVNLAARFESQAKELNVSIVMGEAFAALLPEEARETLTPHRGVQLKGAAPQTLYTVTPTDDRGGELP